MEPFKRLFSSGASVAAFVSLLALSSLALAGSLTPPGSPASTMNTLEELFDSIAGTFDSSAIVSDQDGSLIQHLKYIEENMGGGVGSDSLDFDEFVDSMTLDDPTNIALNGFDFTFTGTGNMGIGTTSPNAVFDMETTTAGPGAFLMQLHKTDLTAGDDVFFKIGKSQAFRNEADISYFHAGDGSATNSLGFGFNGVGRVMVVQADGNVGIATTSPDNLLTVAGGSVVHLARSAPEQIGGTMSGVPIFSIDVAQNVAYATDFDDVRIIDISNPGSPSLMSTFVTPGSASWAQVSGRHLYIADGNALVIADITNPTSPVIVGTLTLGAAATDLAPFNLYVAGRYAYLSDYGNGRMRVVDVSNPTAPVSVFISPFLSASPYYVHATGNLLFAARNNFGFQIWDIRNPKVPIQLSGIDPGNIRGGQIVGRYLYTIGSTGLYVYDIVNPASPVQVYANAGFAGYKLVAMGKYLYVFNGDANFRVFETTDPTALKLVGTYSGGSTIVWASIVGRYAYVADQGGLGFKVLALNGTETPGLSTGGLQAGNLSVWQDAVIGGMLYARTGLNIGNDGLLSVGEGAFDVVSSRSAFRITQRGLGEIFSAYDNMTPAFIVMDGGNVGIGIASSSITARLEVAGTASISGVLFANGGCVGCGGVASDGLDFDEFRDAMTLDANTSIASGGFTLTTNAFVGIGRTTPTAPLDILVSKSAEFGGMVRIQNGAFNGYSNIDFQDYLGVHKLGIGYANPGTTFSPGTIFINAQGGLNLNTFATTRLHITSAGNVGIGSSTTPNAKLDVAGNILASTSGNVDLILNSTGNQDGLWRIRSTSTDGLQILGSASTTLVAVASSGFVGIGSSSPSAHLSVVDNVNVLSNRTTALFSGPTGNSNSGNITLHLKGNLDNATSAAILQIQHTNPAGGSPTTSGRLIHVLGDSTLDASTTDSNNVFSILSNGTAYFLGNLGIGTLTPSTLLEVRSSVAGNFDPLNIASSSGTSFLRVAKTGFVGINDSTPTTTLDVAGNASISGTLELGGLIMNGHLLPGITDTYDLGSSALRWRDLYLASGSLHIGTSGDEAVIDYNVNDDYLAFKPNGSTNALTLFDNGLASLSNGLKVTNGAITVIASPSGSADPGATNYFIAPLYDFGVDWLTDSNRELRMQSYFAGGIGVQVIGYNGYTTNSGGTVQGRFGRYNSIVFGHGTMNFRTNRGAAGTGVTSTITPYDAMTILFSGNVGVGTTSPATKFAVVGSAGNYDILSVASSSGTSFLHVAKGGNVGVGDSTPSYPLEVLAPTTTQTNLFRVSNGSNAYLTFDRTSTNARGALRISENAGATNLIMLSGDGASRSFIDAFSGTFLGLGTSTPDFTLDVEGDIVSSRSDGSPPALGIYNNAAGGSRWQIRAGDGSDAFGNGAFQIYDVTLNRAWFVIASNSGNVGIGPGGARNLRPKEKLDVTGNILASTSGNVDLILHSTTNQDSKFTLRVLPGLVGTLARLSVLSSASTELFTIASTGYVGINDTTPTAPLSVRYFDGNTVSPGTHTVAELLNASIAVGSGPALDFTWGTATPPQPGARIYTSAITTNQATMRFAVNDGSGNYMDALTIHPISGNASMSGILETGGLAINGHLLPGADNSYDLGSSTARWRDLYLASGSLHIGTSGDEAVIDYNVNDDYLSFKPDGSVTKFSIYDDGYAEITGYLGVVSPLSETYIDDDGLTVGDIAGTALTNISRNGALSVVRDDPVNGPSYNWFNNFDILSALPADFSLVEQQGKLTFTSSASGNLMSITSAGNVGIGMIAPTAKLDVVQTSAIADDSIYGIQVLQESTGTMNGGAEREAIGGVASTSGNISGANYGFLTGGDFAARYSGTISDTGGLSNVGLSSTAVFSGTKTSTDYAESIAGYFTASGDMGTTGTTLHTAVNAVNVTGTADANTGLYVHNITGATNNYGIVLSNIPAGVNNFSLHSSASAQSYFAGNLGIGTTSPTAALHVVGPAGLDTTPDVSGIQLGFDGGTYGIKLAHNSVSGTPYIDFGNQTGLAYDFRMIHGFQAGGVFSILSSQAAGINLSGAGSVGIGTTAPARLLHVASAGEGFIQRLSDSDGTCDLDPDSGGLTTSCSSDERLKKNIEDADSVLPSLMAMRIREYTVRSSGDRMIGVIAQEVRATHPELVSVGPNGLLMVQQPGQWEVIKAIQELNGKIEELGTQGPLSFDEPGLFERFLEYLRDTVLSVRKLVASDEICVGDTCLTEAQVQELLEKNGMGESESADDPTPTPETTPESTPEPEINGSNDEPLPESTPDPTPEPEESPESTPEPEEEPQPEPEQAP